MRRGHAGFLRLDSLPSNVLFSSSVVVLRAPVLPLPCLPPAEDTAASGSKKQQGASAASTPSGKKSSKASSSRRSGDEGGWLAGNVRPVPRDVAIVGLILVFAGMR